MADERRHYNEQLANMRNEQSSFVPHWRDINDLIMPRTSRFLVADRANRGNIRPTKIVDNTATRALRTLRSGFMSGVTNPARPWVLFKAMDPDLNKRNNMLQYLEVVRDALLEIFLKSNFYTVLPTTYSNLGGYGTDSFDIEKDAISTVRFYSSPVGSYFLATDDRLEVDTKYRQFEMTTSQLVKKFGIENVSEQVRSAYTRADYLKWFTVVHVCEPNPDYVEGSINPERRKYRSVYYELVSKETQYLRKAGYDRRSFVASRWDLTGEDVYGYSPGMEALGDVAYLNLGHKKKLSVIDKHVNPPTQAPASLEKKGISNVPGGVTYVDMLSNQAPITPTYQTRLEGMQHLIADLQDTRSRIDSTFYKDIFLLLSNSASDPKRTAYEVARLEEEKLLMLGPVYLRINDELLDPAVTTTLEIMVEQSKPYWEGKLNGKPLLPPPPPELQGVPLSFEYISPMSQAMKSVGVNAIERTMTFAGGLAQTFPEVLDNINGDDVIRTYATIVGTPASNMNDEDVVKAVRADRAKKQQAQETAAAMQQGAETAKTASQASLSDNNALSQILARMQPGAGAPTGAP